MLVGISFFSAFDIAVVILVDPFLRTPDVRAIAGYFPLKTYHRNHSGLLSSHNGELFFAGMGLTNETYMRTFFF